MDESRDMHKVYKCSDIYNTSKKEKKRELLMGHLMTALGGQSTLKRLGIKAYRQ
jgi:hypothetical protein